MDADSIQPTSIVIASHPDMSDAAVLAEQIAEYLGNKKLDVRHGSLYDPDLREQVASGSYEMLIALGGDGTMLRAGHLCAPCNVPILGINVGRFGFLTTVQWEDWKSTVDRVVSGDYWLERRMMLRADHLREGKLQSTWEVVNECFVGRGEIVRPVRLITEVDDHFLTTYVADGLIVATPTGSTAYALAAGGPILPPQLRNILIVPVAPHLSVERAIVLDEGSWVRVTVRTDHAAALTIDGQPSITLEDEDQVFVCAGEHTVQFVRVEASDYFYRNLTSRMNQNPTAGALS
ncbi:MAG: NAD(+) kinase [Anaerolineales bacterium]|nr:NAD(+) kinase [Anaerolineales bacterium]